MEDYEGITKDELKGGGVVLILILILISISYIGLKVF